MRHFFIILLALTCLIESISAGNKRALTVFIGDYPEASGWNKIASRNDKDVIFKMLHELGFNADDITSLEDEEATYDAILQDLDSLLSSASLGDMIYIHFSCHGQQITDQDGDEALTNPKDRYDEALIPYDACIAYNWNGYKGEHHLIDDVLNSYMSQICRRIGKDGCLLVVNDACHSGGLEREGKSIGLFPHRGTFDAFEQPLTGRKGQPEIHPVTWISISACKDFQTNFEVNADDRRYGRLSFAISRCFRAGMTARQLMEALREEYERQPLPEGHAQTVYCVIPDKMGDKKLFDR